MWVQSPRPYGSEGSSPESEEPSLCPQLRKDYIRGVSKSTFVACLPRCLVCRSVFKHTGIARHHLM